MVRFGIPTYCYLDNGRNFASKWLTGGAKTRYRFKIKEDEPHGVMTTMGVEVHWTMPYSGQSKPIERWFGECARKIAKHPAFAGAWTGNTPLAKPENYGSKAVPIEDFERVVAEEIAKHNAEVGRRSDVCRGRSFDEAFNESFERSPIRKATVEQRRLWLMAAEGVTVSRQDGSIKFYENRFWATWLTQHCGTKVTARFDPQNIQKDLHVYDLTGVYLGAAQCVHAVGFNDMDASQTHNRDRKAWEKAVKEKAEAERRLSTEQLARMQPKIERIEAAPEPKIIRPVRGSVAPAMLVAENPDAQPASREELLFQKAMRMQSEGRLRVVEDPDE